MKIFNWVHRRFHHKEDHLSGHNKKAGDQKESLLEDASFNSVLAIGTFGFECHPFTNFNDEPKENYSTSIDNINDDVEKEEELEVKPLLIIPKASPLINYPRHFDENIINNNTEISTCVESPDDDIINGECDDKIRSGKRITLADLLSADSGISNDVMTNKKDDDGNNEIKESGKSGKKRLSSFTKKLIPDQVKDKNSVRPVHQKVKKLMTRMMKRKIHPDNEGNKNIQKNESMPNARSS